MDRCQVKSILIFCRDIDGEISYNRERLKEYDDIYCSISGGGELDGMPRSKNKISSQTESTALNIPDSVIETVKELRKKIERLTALRTAILEELNRLSLHQKIILHDFYIRGFQWVQISGRVNYSGTQCKKIRNRALDNLGKHFEKNELIKNFNYPS